MFDQEQDPSRCREIREIIRDIQSRRTTIVEQERNKRSQMTQLRNQLSERHDQREEALKAEITSGLVEVVGVGAGFLARTVASARAARSIGSASGTSSVAAAIQAANLQSQIRVLESQISSLEHDINKIQDEMDRLLRSEGENARELSRLNCVAP